MTSEKKPTAIVAVGTVEQNQTGKQASTCLRYGYPKSRMNEPEVRSVLNVKKWTKFHLQKTFAPRHAKPDRDGGVT